MRARRLAALLLALLAVGACSAPPPEPDPLVVAQRYFEAVGQGDFRTVRRIAWLPSSQEEVKAAMSRVRATSRNMSEGHIDLVPVEAQERGDWALVALRLTQYLPTGEVLFLRKEWLLRVDGRWRLVAPSLLTHAQLTERRDEDHFQLEDWYTKHRPELEERWIRLGEPTAEQP